MHQYLRSAVLGFPPRLSRRELILVGRVGILPPVGKLRVSDGLRLGHCEAVRLLRRLDCRGGGGAIYAVVRSRVRLTVVNDRMLLIRRGRWARKGRRRLWRVEVRGILIKVLELFALVVVKGVLSKECVSPRLSNKTRPLVKRAAEGVHGEHGEDGEKKAGSRSRIRYRYRYLKKQQEMRCWGYSLAATCC